MFQQLIFRGKKMRLRKRQVQTFSIFTTILLILSLILPGFVGAQNAETSISLNDSESVQGKVNERLLEEFKEEDQVRFLVKFKEKADLDAAVNKAEEKVKKQKSFFLQ